MKTIFLEYCIAKYFNWRKNIIVPNISWGMDLHECDLLILSKSGYATEVEIKISLSDFKKDLLKKHKHKNDKIKYLYFAIPEKLKNYVDLIIPIYAGILIVKNDGFIEKVREPIKKSDYKFTEQEKFKIARLGCMRIFNLKKRIIDLKQKYGWEGK